MCVGTPLEDGVLLTRDQLAQWGGESVTADLLARLRIAIPNSSIPDAMSGCEDDTAQRWCVAHLPDDHPQAHLKTS
jgi:hypothetical protein